MLRVLAREAPNREAAHRQPGQVLPARIDAVMRFDPVHRVPDIGFAHPFVSDVAAAKRKKRDHVLAKTEFVDAETFLGNHAMIGIHAVQRHQQRILFATGITARHPERKRLFGVVNVRDIAPDDIAGGRFHENDE